MAPRARERGRTASRGPPRFAAAEVAHFVVDSGARSGRRSPCARMLAHVERFAARKAGASEDAERVQHDRRAQALFAVHAVRLVAGEQADAQRGEGVPAPREPHRLLGPARPCTPCSRRPSRGRQEHVGQRMRAPRSVPVRSMLAGMMTCAEPALERERHRSPSSPLRHVHRSACRGACAGGSSRPGSSVLPSASAAAGGSRLHALERGALRVHQVERAVDDHQVVDRRGVRLSARCRTSRCRRRKG